MAWFSKVRLNKRFIHRAINNTMIPRTPRDILAERFRIIEQEVGAHSFTAAEWPVVRRLIHASGDVSLVPEIRFHNDPVTAGLKALARHSPMVTDVTMVRAGINETAANKLGVHVHCFLNE